MYELLPYSDEDDARLSNFASNSTLQHTVPSHEVPLALASNLSHDAEQLLKKDKQQIDNITSEAQAELCQPPLTFNNSSRSKTRRTLSRGSFHPISRTGHASPQWKSLLSYSARPFKKLSNEGADSEVSSKKRRAGWRVGTLACCFAVGLCIVIELTLLIWAVSSSIGDSGSGVLMIGNCDRVKILATWLLLPLNIAATVLISTSNYVMQIASATSRSEIDQAYRHAQATSICGMTILDSSDTHGGRARRIIWWILVLSSLPIHLLLNSAIYSSVQASDTGVLVVSEDFESDVTWAACDNAYIDTGSQYPTTTVSSFACQLMRAFKTGKTATLSRSECISQYATGFQTNASSVVVVVAAGSASWYSPPSHLVQVPASYGTLCVGNYSSGYSSVSDSERYFQFDYEPINSSVTISIPPYTSCEVGPTTNRTTGESISALQPGNHVDPYKSSANGLFFANSDALSNITSIRSIFDAVNYRYWATAEMNGDYLKDDYFALANGWDTRSWLCPILGSIVELQCDATALITNPEWKLTPEAMPVIGCHVHPKEEKCTLQYSWRILLVTVVCDIIKIVAMVAALKFVSEPLITLGDVLASFLQQPDLYTENRCLLDGKGARDLTKTWAKKKLALRDFQVSTPGRLRKASLRKYALTYYDIREENDSYNDHAEDWLSNGGAWWSTVEPIAKPEQWTARQRRWVSVPSKTRWLLFAGFYASAMAATVSYLFLGVRELKTKRVSDVWNAGWSGPDSNALWEGGILSNTYSISGAATIVNLPQLLFSGLYFLFNSLFTMMHSAKEWTDFTKHRKALRASSPKGQQRSTYWLQLPWRYSLPLIIASGSLHWLLGRSIYLVKINVSDCFGEATPESDFFAAGYNPSTTLALIIILGLTGLTLLWVAFRKLEPGIPLALFDSLAVAAACHSNSEEDIALRPLMWGVLRDETGVDTSHCSFSAREVSPLKEGASYM